jgi:hypothetical protein
LRSIHAARHGFRTRVTRLSEGAPPVNITLLLNNARVRRSLPMALVVLFIGAGAYLLFVRPSAKDLVEAALKDLGTAVEARDVPLMGSRLHADYDGWGADRDTLLGAFEYATTLYNQVNINFDEIDIVIDDATGEATVTFTWRATTVRDLSAYGGSSNQRIPSRPTRATAVFRQDDTGRWQLRAIESEIPFPEPKG